MSNFDFARKITHISFTGAATVEVESGSPIRIWGFSISNIGVSTATCTLQIADGSSVIAVHNILAGGNFISEIKWIADKGLEFVSSGAGAADLEVTVWHSHPGS